MSKLQEMRKRGYGYTMDECECGEVIPDPVRAPKYRGRPECRDCHRKRLGVPENTYVGQTSAQMQAGADTYMSIAQWQPYDSGKRGML